MFHCLVLVVTYNPSILDDLSYLTLKVFCTKFLVSKNKDNGKITVWLFTTDEKFVLSF